MHGMKPLWIARIVANLGAKVLHVGVDGTLVALEVVAQNLFNQFHARVHAARVAAQRGKQLEFAGGKVNLFAAYEDLMTRNVDGELAEFQHFALRLRFGMHTAQKGTHASNQFAGAERLDKVVVRAQF